MQRALALTAQSTPDTTPLLSLHEQQGDILAMEGAYEEARTALTTAVHHTTHAIDHARLLRKQDDTWVAQQQQTTALVCYDVANGKIQHARIYLEMPVLFQQIGAQAAQHA